LSELPSGDSKMAGCWIKDRFPAEKEGNAARIVEKRPQ
jgi:hypothetical protein